MDLFFIFWQIICHIWWFFKVLQQNQHAQLWKIIKYAKKLAKMKKSFNHNAQTIVWFHVMEFRYLIRHYLIHSGPENLKNSWNQIIQFHERIFWPKSIFLQFPWVKLIFGIFEIAKNGFWSKYFFVKLIYLIPRVFLAWTF